MGSLAGYMHKHFGLINFLPRLVKVEHSPVSVGESGEHTTQGLAGKGQMASGRPELWTTSGNESWRTGHCLGEMRP